jgi:type IX secretion system substrate protein
MLIRFIYSVIFIICSINLFAQTAADYFPQQTGFVWQFKTTPLDSLNNPVNELAVTSIDSFAARGNYFGRDANLVLSKSGTEGTINFLPYLDSSYVSFNGSNASQYLSFLSLFDSIGGSDLSFLNFLNSLVDWYDVYRFDTPVDNEYSLFKIDTTVTISTQGYPIRFEIRVKRQADENISTAIGTFTAKKFDVITKISLILTTFPFPVFVPIFTLPSTNWIAPGNWIVKNYRSSLNVDLVLINGPSFFISGSQTIIQNPLTSVDEKGKLDFNFQLFQNYPNPFNPSTKISFNLLNDGNVNLTVYDLLGRKVKVIVDEHYRKGEHSIFFDSESIEGGLSSGVYFYKLVSSGQSQIKKMILSK